MQGIREWLGWSTATTVVGLHVCPTHLSMVALRLDPVRIVGVGRQLVYDAAVVDDEVRLTMTLANETAALGRALRVPEDTGVVVTVEPTAPTFVAIDDQGPTACPVRQQSYDRLTGAVQRSGFRLLGVDPVPAALARLARVVHPGTAALRGGFRWSIVTGADYTEGERSAGSDGPRLGVGPDLGSITPLDIDRLPLSIPRRLRAAIDLDRDGAALGAALAALGLAPQVEVVPTAGGGRDWVVQPVSPLRRNGTGGQPGLVHRDQGGGTGLPDPSHWPPPQPTTRPPDWPDRPMEALS